MTSYWNTKTTQKWLQWWQALWCTRWFTIPTTLMITLCHSYFQARSVGILPPSSSGSFAFSIWRECLHSNSLQLSRQTSHRLSVWMKYAICFFYARSMIQSWCKDRTKMPKRGPIMRTCAQETAPSFVEVHPLATSLWDYSHNPAKVLILKIRLMTMLILKSVRVLNSWLGSW